MGQVWLMFVSMQISSRYDGVVKKLHYEAGDMAIVGKARLSATLLQSSLHFEMQSIDCFEFALSEADYRN